MDRINSNSSFIPQKAYSTGAKPVRSIDLVFVIALLLFSLSVISALGVFLYKNILENKIVQSSDLLEGERENFDVSTIKQLSLLDKRIKSTKRLLDEHVDLIGFFEALEVHTLKNIQFMDLDLKLNEDNSATVNMKGVSRNYAAIALQSDVFGEHPLIKDPIFSNLSVDDLGGVNFDFSAKIDGLLISYRERIK
ncbi:hypothetical protein A2442_02135 [Candidatus Campbellbacteria bacterium RIFOXYC2_FULL_35_25]|uniref:PilN domain-containing protein n=1 Tax=Candidatus Campbellbacteria bacterium RIFOXYC2_FULL_35_25 TaxID=1797582 RepID=A0A1F5EIL0_9BACT|nr:MAG: hypothetical protein A2442_02135 [Candidatus Campbellbacteria bacterium RIFOXYC2_FULL_35_25]